MNLYGRNYAILTDKEQREYDEIRKQERGEYGGMECYHECLFDKYPKAARHFNSMFPNNYLDPIELKDKTLLKELDLFLQLIDSEGVDERNIIDHIKKRRAWFLIGALLQRYHFGHHEAYLFPEFQLGNTYQVDYLLAGKSSNGWEFVYVELESPTGKITLRDGALGLSFRKGIEQVEEWDRWLQSNYASIKETFKKSRPEQGPLPKEYLEYDRSRFHYLVVAGRRTDFKDKTYRIRRERQKEKSQLILHYDNILEAAEHVIGKSTY